MSEANKISVTRALATLKVVEAKLSNAVLSQVPVLLAAGVDSCKSIVGSNTSVEEAVQAVKTSYQSVTDLINQREKLKAAIVQSNAVTNVVVGSQTMTVAAAIEAKRSITFKVDLLERLKAISTETVRKFNVANTHFEAKLDTARKEFANGAAKKVTEEDLKVITNPIELRQKPSIIDPLEISKVIEKLENEVADFLLNVDFALSESNAKTEIVI